MQKLHTITIFVSIVLVLLGTMATASGSPNIGLLRVSTFICPREVVPGANFAVSLDVEYAIQTLPDEATIRGAVYDGSANSGSLLWQSDPTSVSNGGDQVWNFTLTAPSSEGFFSLSAYAFFLNNGTWTYFNNSVNGPGVDERTVKIGKTANLDINIGAPNIGVTVDGTTQRTSASGDALFNVAVGGNPSVSVPSIAELQNSTRIIFTQWSDGVADTQRQVPIDGDVNLTALYRIQYLLTVNNSPSTQTWYDKGANATLTAPTTTTGPWPLSVFGVTETFQDWSGDIQSASPQVNVTMDSPKTVTAVMSSDYGPLAIPIILGVGAVAAIVTFALVQRNSVDGSAGTIEQSAIEGISDDTAEETVKENPTCPGCGQETEPDWAHCIKCGTKLADANSSTNPIEN